MADFRRWYLALAAPLLFTGVASAQVGTTGSTPLTCTANSTTTPTIRLEGITELVGDIVISCTGGAIVPNIGNGGAATNPAAQQTNIIVTLPQSVTSRLVPGSSTISNVSEALLLIDEPQSGEAAPVAGFGPQAPFTVCSTPNTGCGAFVLSQTEVSGTTTAVYQTGVNSSTATQANAVTGPNVFQGLVSGNQVTFFGVPIVPPGTNGQRVFRITNLRLNASGLTAGASVTANVSVTGFTISNPTPIVAFAQKSLSATVTPSSAFGQCNTQTLSQASILTYGELFANAFKTRVDTSVAGLSGLPAASSYLQDVPGHLYNSESGLTLNTAGLTGAVGLADSGTRLTAVFNNLPTNVRIFVSQYDVAVSVLGVVSNQTTNSAQAITGEGIPDSNSIIPAATAFSTKAPGPFGGTIPVVEITPTAGTTATASWEIITSTPTAIQKLNFAVYITYTASPATDSPAPGAITVNERYGPSSTVTTAAASPVPRFLDTSTATNAFLINLCRTILLFPFITNQAGFDTGIAIANTSTDPFGTPPQNGTCSWNWYGSAAPSTAYVTPSVATGTDFATLASIVAPGFQGYMISICNFQFAHGFAFVDTAGLNGVAVGYLANVIPDPALQTPLPGRIPSNSAKSAGSDGEGLAQ